MFVFFRPTSDPKDVESVDEAGASFAAASLQQVCRFCEGWFRDVFSLLPSKDKPALQGNSAEQLKDNIAALIAACCCQTPHRQLVGQTRRRQGSMSISEHGTANCDIRVLL